MEIWKDIAGHEGRYQVSDAGRVRSLDRIVVTRLGVPKRTNGRILALKPNVGGYLSLRLGRGVPVMVHQLVAEAFIGKCEKGIHVCHNDGNKENNTPSNLRHDTPKGNQADRAIHGTKTEGVKCYRAVLDDDKVREIRKLIEAKELTHSKIAKQYGVVSTTISLIASGRNWKHVV